MDVIFEVFTPLGFSVRVPSGRWNMIVEVKHPVMYGRESDVYDALQMPDEVRRSRSDPSVFLFYRLEYPGRWVCVVIKKINNEGFLITAYPTDTIKEGERVWKK